MGLLSRFAAAWSSITQGQSGFATPDVTRAQKVALGQAVVTVLVVLGFDLDASTQQLLIGLSAALAATLPISDAVVRHGRAANAESIAKARDEQGDAPVPDQLGLGDADRAAVLADLLALQGRRRSGAD
jgi:hypothetical protein